MDSDIKMYLQLIGDWKFMENPEVSDVDKTAYVDRVKRTMEFQVWLLGREVRGLKNTIEKKLDVLTKVMMRK